jgi:hypothetical protein
MHSTPSGSAVSGGLMQGTDASSTCLICHGGITGGPQQVLTTSTREGVPPANYTPGGDFAWLMKSYSWNTPQGIGTSPGERHGHNVVASDFGLFPDSTLLAAPGGTYPSSRLSCISCHDPHGRYRTLDDGTVASKGKPIAASGSYGDPASFVQPTKDTAVGVYRMLGGVGYQPKSLGGALAFGRDPPIALAPSTYNQSERVFDVRVAYGSGMSEWCANCHGEMHMPAGGSSSSFLHPSGALAKLGMAATIYNIYVKTGDVTGTWALSYSSLVPYEEGTTNRATLAAHARNDGSAVAGPLAGTENVSCLSCHRAHASGWDGALRWNQKSEYIVAAGQWPGVDALSVAAKPIYAQGRMVAETRGAMYERLPSKYASFQTALCNKCHAK